MCSHHIHYYPLQVSPISSPPIRMPSIQPNWLGANFSHVNLSFSLFFCGSLLNNNSSQINFESVFSQSFVTLNTQIFTCHSFAYKSEEKNESKSNCLSWKYTIDWSDWVAPWPIGKIHNSDTKMMLINKERMMKWKQMHAHTVNQS